MSDARASLQQRQKVGELRPSQLLYMYGVGAIVDLPHLSAMVMGLDEWDTHPSRARPILEERLLAAVQAALGDQVAALLSPPRVLEEAQTGRGGPAAGSTVGVPVASFPRWMLCPRCRLLAPVGSGLFKLKDGGSRPDRARYVHENCPKQPNSNATVLPARFLVACKDGHLDDFPWVQFVHRGGAGCGGALRLDEFGPTGDAASIQVRCERCTATRRMADAFGNDTDLPPCTGRWPHLRRHDEEACKQRASTILLGASNSWFPEQISALAIPQQGDGLARRVESAWSDLNDVESAGEIGRMMRRGDLAALADLEPEAIWVAIQARREVGGTTENATDLLSPEWRAFSDPAGSPVGDDFLLRRVEAPHGFADQFEGIVLAERLRLVNALVGFTRIESPAAFGEASDDDENRRVPLSSRTPTWVPATEVRGEGIFLRIRENRLQAWEERVRERRDQRYAERLATWRARRGLPPGEERDAGFFRTLLLHSLAHVVMRQLALECGYAVASIAERIYATPPGEENGPMAGVLLYTAAPDSEGTLGGLVRLGSPAMLGAHIARALEQAALCASDPHCAEHTPDRDAWEQHWAACHACLFVPETSCVMGNRMLDRSLLVETYEEHGIAFFGDRA